MPIRVVIEGIDESVRALDRALDNSLRDAVVRIARGVGERAKTEHPWQKRTGNLEASTAGSNVVWGDVWNDTLAGEVVADTEYAQYLEGNPQWAWLDPAWHAYEPTATEMLDAAMDEACRVAGWG